MLHLISNDNNINSANLHMTSYNASFFFEGWPLNSDFILVGTLEKLRIKIN